MKVEKQAAASDIVVSQAVINRFFFCLSPRYYSQESCSCVCHYQYCSPGWYWSESYCECIPYLT